MGRSPLNGESHKKKAVVEAEEEEEEEEEVMVKRGAWTSEEDEKLIAFIQKNHGHGTWKTLPKLAGLQRCGKSCRLRWTNYLRPDIRRCGFSLAEERTIIHLHSLLGNRWSGIASHLAGRTDNDVKNHWNTHLKKRLLRAGIDPETHQPIGSMRARPSACQAMREHVVASNNQLDPSVISHTLQWELVRLEAESKLASTANSTTSDGPFHHQSSTGLHHQEPHELIFHHSSTRASTDPNSNTMTIQMLQNSSTRNSSHTRDSEISHEQSPTGLCPSIVNPSIQGSNPDNIINHHQFDLDNICGTRLLSNDQTQSIIPAPTGHSCEMDSLEMNSCSGSTSTNYHNTSTVTTPDYQCTTSMRSEESINQSLPILDNSPAASDLMSSLIPSLVSCEDNSKDYWATLLRLLSHDPSRP